MEFYELRRRISLELDSAGSDTFQLRKILVVIKMRGGNHSRDIREYEITAKGVVIIGDRLTDYQGLITGIPVHLNRSSNREERSHKPKAKS